MAQCPKCKNTLKEEFGIETCSKCGAVVFIDLNDHVSLQDDAPSETIELQTEESGDQEIQSEILVDDLFSDDQAEEAGEEEKEAKTTLEPQMTSASDFFSEMQAFGEMDSDKFKEGVYFFDLIISNIDSKETRGEILDGLSEARLNLKILDLEKKIKNGILSLTNISAVKTYVIVQRLSHLPCEISWNLKEVQDISTDASDSENSVTDDLET